MICTATCESLFDLMDFTSMGLFSFLPDRPTAAYNKGFASGSKPVVPTFSECTVFLEEEAERWDGLS